MKILNLFNIFIVFLLFSISCSTKVAKFSDYNTLDSIVKNKLGANYKIITNESGTHSIILKKIKEFKDLIPDIDFFVFDITKNEIIFEDKLTAGSIRWINDYEIEGAARNLESDSTDTNNRIVYIFNVITKIKTILSSN